MGFISSFGTKHHNSLSARAVGRSVKQRYSLSDRHPLQPFVSLSVTSAACQLTEQLVSHTISQSVSSSRQSADFRAARCTQLPKTWSGCH